MILQCVPSKQAVVSWPGKINILMFIIQPFTQELTNWTIFKFLNILHEKIKFLKLNIVKPLLLKPPPFICILLNSSLPMSLWEIHNYIRVWRADYEATDRCEYVCERAIHNNELMLIDMVGQYCSGWWFITRQLMIYILNSKKHKRGLNKKWCQHFLFHKDNVLEVKATFIFSTETTFNHLSCLMSLCTQRPQWNDRET